MKIIGYTILGIFCFILAIAILSTVKIFSLLSSIIVPIIILAIVLFVFIVAGFQGKSNNSNDDFYQRYVPEIKHSGSINLSN